MARKDKKNDKRRITLPERMKIISVELAENGFPETSCEFKEDGLISQIIARGIRAHVRAALKRNPK